MANAPLPPPADRLGRCRGAFWLALSFDALGLAALVPAFVLEHGDYSDLLVYVAGVNVFFSLPWWVFWYVGNLEVPPEDDGALVDQESLLRQGALHLLYLCCALCIRCRAACGCLRRPARTFQPTESVASSVHERPHLGRTVSWTTQEVQSTA